MRPQACLRDILAPWSNNGAPYTSPNICGRRLVRPVSASMALGELGNTDQNLPGGPISTLLGARAKAPGPILEVSFPGLLAQRGPAGGNLSRITTPHHPRHPVALGRSRGALTGVGPQHLELPAVQGLRPCRAGSPRPSTCLVNESSCPRQQLRCPAPTSREDLGQGGREAGLAAC